jgi:hypothetical protein
LCYALSVMNIKAKIALHEEQIRKLKELDALLSDPEMAVTAREILLASARVAPATHSEPERRVRRNPAGRKRNLKKRALEIVRSSASLLTAKDVAEIMEKEGYTFRAKNSAVAVSKALRSLAQQKEIDLKRGDRDKSAIKYGALPSLLTLPVQETTH